MSILSFLGGLLGIGPTRRTITISKSATNAGLPFVIGEARLKAIPVFTHISRQNGPLGTVTWDYSYDPRPSHGDEEVKDAMEWLHRIDVFAQGPITGFVRFYVDVYDTAYVAGNVYSIDAELRLYHGLALLAANLLAHVTNSLAFVRFGFS